jgi:hypothetical protein
LWCNDYATICNALNFIKTEDNYNFYSKIRCISINYDKSESNEVIQKEKLCNTKTLQFLKTRCINLDELWNMKFELFDKITKQEGH